MKYIPITKGKFAIVDDEDYDWLLKYKWSYNNGCSSGYALRALKKHELDTEKEKYPTVSLMHRQIMNCPDGMVIDHINGNGLDNKKQNLRICTQAQNNINSRGAKNAISKYKGVSISPRGCIKPWMARIRLNNKETYLGTFETEELASLAYEEAAKIAHGEFYFNNINRGN